MTAALLERAPATGALNVDQEFSDRCRRELGYEGFGRARTEDKVKEALRRLDVRPFTPESVRRYKRREQSKSGHERLLTGMFGAVAAVTITTIISLWLCSAVNTIQLLWMLLCLLFMEFVVFGSMFVACAWNWERVPLRHVTSLVPEFALQTALDVRAALGEEVPCQFFVESLQRAERQADPFLVLRVNDRDWYLEVWNEPNFKGKREV